MSAPDRDTILANLQPTFSGSKPRLPDLTPDVVPIQLWRDPDMQISSILQHPTFAGFIFAADRSIEVLCKPRLSLLADHSSDVIGFIGDRILDWLGGYVDQEELQLKFLGIIAKDDAVALDIQHSSVDLRTVTLSDGKTPFFKSLPTFDDPDAVPVAAILHRAIPFEFGDFSPQRQYH